MPRDATNGRDTIHIKGTQIPLPVITLLNHNRTLPLLHHVSSIDYGRDGNGPSEAEAGMHAE